MEGSLVGSEDSSKHLRHTVRATTFLLEPMALEDARLDIIGPNEALDTYLETSWAREVPDGPTLILCRYSDATSRRQPAWLAVAGTAHEVPLPWYFGLEQASQPPAAPWECMVVINASNGIRIRDHVYRQPRSRA